MNHKQRATLKIGAVAVAIMALFPPWHITFQIENTKLVHRFAGYHPLWRANTPTDTRVLSEWFSESVGPESLSYFSIHIDTTRLLIQISVTLIISALLCASFSGADASASRKKRQAKEGEERKVAE